MECFRENKLQKELQILLKKVIDWFNPNDEDTVWILEIIVRIHFKIFVLVYQLSFCLRRLQTFKLFRKIFSKVHLFCYIHIPKKLY